METECPASIRACGRVFEDLWHAKRAQQQPEKSEPQISKTQTLPRMPTILVRRKGSTEFEDTRRPVAPAVRTITVPMPKPAWAPDSPERYRERQRIASARANIRKRYNLSLKDIQRLQDWAH